MTRSPPANDEKTSDFVTKFVNMGAATGSSIFFPAANVTNQNKKKETLGCASWPCPNIGYPLIVYHQLPYYLMATTGNPWEPH